MRMARILPSWKKSQAKYFQRSEGPFLGKDRRWPWYVASAKSDFRLSAWGFRMRNGMGAQGLLETVFVG